MDRSESIRSNLSLGSSLSPDASEINEQIQLALADLDELPLIQQRKVFSALMVQISGKLSKIV